MESTIVVGTVRPAAGNPARQRRKERQQGANEVYDAPRARESDLASENQALRSRRPPAVTLPAAVSEHPSWGLKELPPPSGMPARSSSAPPILVWIRVGDLRLGDNPALHAAVKMGVPVICVFVLSPASEEGGWPLKGAAKYWLHHSLKSLQHALAARGSALVLRDGRAHGTLLELNLLMSETGAVALHFNAAYEPWKQKRDAEIADSLQAAGVSVWEFPGNVLYEPQLARPDERSAGHGFGSVGFFLNAVAKLPKPPEPLPAPSRLCAPTAWPRSEHLSDLGLARLPRRDDGTSVDWARGMRAYWAVGEEGALEALSAFLTAGIDRFEGRQRFRADLQNTAAISPFLRFGELSARIVLHEVKSHVGPEHSPTFLRRLAWRDLAIWSLWRFPSLPDQPFRKWFDKQAAPPSSHPFRHPLSVPSATLQQRRFPPLPTHPSHLILPPDPSTRSFHPLLPPDPSTRSSHPSRLRSGQTTRRL